MIEDIAIIGAGPYGLSIAAHLNAEGIRPRIFGNAMRTWQTQMPAGMFLKSEGFASSLSDPAASYTLAHHCTARGIPYADTGAPVALETFLEYGLAFQKRFVPELEEQPVARLEQHRQGFRLTLDDGSAIDARRVVVAAGLSHFAHLPPELASTPEPHVIHSSRVGAAECYAGQDVIVIGAGASAIDTALSLRGAGASVRLVARGPALRFHEPPQPRSLFDRVRAPMSGLGPGWRSRLCTDAPLWFHVMPERFRLAVTRRHLGPAPCWWTKDQLVGEVPIHPGMRLRGTEIQGSRVVLRLADTDEKSWTFSADRVVAATGFRVDLRRLSFIDDKLRSLICVAEQTPVLSANFEASVRGLHFVGAASANSFGPMMRFVYGTGYTARRLVRHLVTSRVKAGIGHPVDPGIQALSYDS